MKENYNCKCGKCYWQCKCDDFEYEDMEENKYKKVEAIIAKRVNKTRANKNGYRGISPTPYSKFASHFAFSDGNNKVKLHLGNYDTAEEAYIARIKFIDSLK